MKCILMETKLERKKRLRKETWHRNKHRHTHTKTPKEYFTRYCRTAKGRFNLARSTARKTKREWTITFEQYAKLILKPCTYCGSPLNATGSGLDRADNSIGYTLENSLPCCANCNQMKGHRLTEAEMRAAMTAVLKLRTT